MGGRQMQIHVVQQGETLFQIAQTYGVTENDLITSNEIPNPNQLVKGQTIVIPIWGSYHWVQPGETIYSISQQYGMSMNQLIELNQITNPEAIPVGFRLYIPQQNRPVVDVAAYIDPLITGDESVQAVNRTAEHLTFLNIFQYAINLDGTLTPVENDQALINAAYEHRTAPLMVISNFEEGTFTNELATEFLNNEELQDQILDEAIEIMQEKGYLGIDFDIEYVGGQNREAYNRFLQKARNRLKEYNFFLSTALAPKISGEQQGVLYEGHDYAAHGQIADFIFFMTYEWGWSGGPPMAVSPLNEVRKVMDYAISVVPRDKIMMGIPLYGYDWTLPYVEGGPFARSISPQQAIMLAVQHNVSIQYDTTSQAPFFYYTDSQGRQHVVWFEDARSIQAKFNLVKELGIRGFFYWVLGREFPQNWLLVRDNFVVRKRV